MLEGTWPSLRARARTAKRKMRDGACCGSSDRVLYLGFQSGSSEAVSKSIRAFSGTIGSVHTLQDYDSSTEKLDILQLFLIQPEVVAQFMDDRQTDLCSRTPASLEQTASIFF